MTGSAGLAAPYDSALTIRLDGLERREQGLYDTSVDGSIALQSAFELTGRVAMQELMTDSNVTAALAGFEQYLDAKKLEAINSSD